MADRQLILDLLARDKTGQATRSAADNLADVGDAAEDAAKATEQLGKESGKTDDKVGGLGKSSRTAAQHVAALDDQIEGVNGELRQMATAWNDANDAAERDEITKAIRRTQRELRQLEKNRGILAAGLPTAQVAPDPQPIQRAAKSIDQLEHELVQLKAAYVGARTESERLDLGKAIGGAEKQIASLKKFGDEAGGSFLDSFSQTLQAAGPAKIGAVIGGVLSAAALAPALGAVVSAGILGGFGAGGVIGGLKIAAKDARVKSEAKKLADFVGEQLGNSAGSFVPAALEGLDELRSGFEEIDDDLRSIFDSSARYVGPLVRGLTGLVEQAIGGVDDAVAAAAPIFDVLERNLPELGGVIGDVLSQLADNGPAAAVALEQVIHVIEGAVVTVGGLVDALTTVYAGLALSGVLGEEARENWIKYSVEAATAKKNSDAFAGSQEGVAEKAKTAAEAVEQERKAIQELNNLLRAESDPLFAFGQAQDKVAEAQEKYDKAVKEHGKNSKEARAATRDLSTAFLGLNDAASKIPTTADGKITPAFRRMLEEGGAAKEEIKAIETELARLRGQADKYDGLNARAKFSADTGAAAARVGSLLAQIAKVRSKSITLRVGVVGASAAVRVASILSGKAEGGPVEAGTPYIVGEKRPEVFVPETNGTIVPSVGQFTGGGARMGGSSVATGTSRDSGWVVVRGDAIIDALTQKIAERVSARGGRAAQLGIRFV